MSPEVYIEQNFIATSDYIYDPPYKSYIYVELSKDTYEVINDILEGDDLILDVNIKKVTDGLVSSEIIKSIEDAIRYKLRSTDDYSPPQMADAIMNIPQDVDGVFGEKTIRSNGVYDAISDSLDGYNKVTVDVPSSGGAPINLYDPTFTSNGSYIPPDGYDGFFEVKVEVPEKQYNSGEKEITENGDFFASTYGYDGFSKVSVNVEQSTYVNREIEFVSNGVYNAFDYSVDGFNKVTVNLNIKEGEFVFGPHDINENGEFFANDFNLDGFSSVNVNVHTLPNLQDIDIIQNGSYSPSIGYDGFFNVNVNVLANVTSLQISSNGTYSPPSGSGLDGYNDIFVSVPASVEEINITQNGIFTPPSGVDGFNKVNVQVPLPALEDKTILTNGDYYPSGSNYGFSHVNVQVPEKLIGERSVITSNGVYLASDNSLDGFTKVNVQVPSTPQANIQTSKSVTLSDSATINPDSGYDAMASVIATVTHPPLQDQKTLSVSYGTTTINPDGTNVAMKKVVVTTPAQPTYGTKTFTTNGVYNANSYGFDGFNQVNVQVPTGQAINWNKVVYYRNGSSNSVIPDNRYNIGGYPTFGFDYSGITRVNIGDAIVDGSHMFDSTNINATIYHTGGEFYDYGYMFNNCTSFNSSPPFFEITNAIDLRYMFSGCSSYDYAGIPIRSTYSGYENVSAESMFRDCTNLSSAEVQIGMGITGLADTSNMFKNCISYSRNINYPNCIKESRYMFDGCTNFNGNIIFNASATYMNIQNMAFMFNGCINFNSNFVNVTNFGCNSYYMMFANCKNFNKQIPNLYPGSPTLIAQHFLNASRMFFNCQKFNQKVNIYAGNINTALINTFLNCFNMDSVVNIYVNGAVRLEAIDMFRGCNNFKSNVYILKGGSADINQNQSYLYTSGIYNRNTSSQTQSYRMNIICGSTNIYNAFLRDMSSPPAWSSFSDGVYNSKYNVYVYNHL